MSVLILTRCAALYDLCLEYMVIFICVRSEIYWWDSFANISSFWIRLFRDFEHGLFCLFEATLVWHGTVSCCFQICSAEDVSYEQSLVDMINTLPLKDYVGHLVTSILQLYMKDVVEDAEQQLGNQSMFFTTHLRF